MGPETAAELCQLRQAALRSRDFATLDQYVVELRTAGFSFATIAAPMGVTPEGAWKMAVRGGLA